MRSNEKYNTVYEFIKKYITENGYSPSVREICANCGIKSTATAYQYINKLNEQGLIKKAGNKKRAVSLKKSVGQSVSVPLVGTVAAGQPIFADENYEGYYSLPTEFFGSDDMFMLTVKGDSMIKIGMFDGDKIIVKKQNTADNGDIVVALVDDSATVKRFYRRDGKFILHPENDSMSDFLLDDVSVLGKVVCLMRNI